MGAPCNNPRSIADAEDDGSRRIRAAGFRQVIYSSTLAFRALMTRYFDQCRTAVCSAAEPVLTLILKAYAACRHRDGQQRRRDRLERCDLMPAALAFPGSGRPHCAWPRQALPQGISSAHRAGCRRASWRSSIPDCLGHRAAGTRFKRSSGSTLPSGRAARIDRLYGFGIARSDGRAVRDLGWAHPLTAAGVLFPDRLGWRGVHSGGNGCSHHAIWRAAALRPAWLGCVQQQLDPAAVASGWTSIDTMMGASLGQKADLDHRARSRARVQIVESASRCFPKAHSACGRRRSRGSGSKICGRAIRGRWRRSVVGATATTTCWSKSTRRVPSPIVSGCRSVSMWQPWRACPARAAARGHISPEPRRDY